MTVEEARQVLAKVLNFRGELEGLKPFLFWKPGDTHAHMDGKFSARALEAVLTLMRADGQA